jgi:hypothetical protein
VSEHREGCSGELHAHVVYDHETNIYRAHVRCGCYLLSQIDDTPHKRYLDAERAALALPLLVTAAARTPRRRPGFTRGGRPPKKKPLPPAPTPIEVDTVWLVWWRDLMKRHGHESRL